MGENNRTIAIFGTGLANPGQPVYELAHRTGRLLAKAGYDIVNGGYAGTMLAAAKGANEACGRVTGVICSAFGKRQANEFVTEVIVTESLEERLDTLIKLGQGYVVLPGGTGTLLELAKVWELRNKGFADTDKPIILVGQFWQPLAELIARDDADSAGCVTFADGPEEVVTLLNKYL